MAGAKGYATEAGKAAIESSGSTGHEEPVIQRPKTTASAHPVYLTAILPIWPNK